MTGRTFSTTARFSLPVPIQRARVKFSRSKAAVGYTHLQQIDLIRRALEKSSWPTSKTAGKRPKLKISFGPAISVGYESDCEYCDIELVARLDTKTAKEDLQQHLPAGYFVVDVKSIPRFFPSLEKSLNMAQFEIRSPLLLETGPAWEKFWAETHFIVTKKKGDGDVAIDARPLVHTWKLEEDRLELKLRFGPGKTLKPERIVQVVCGFNDEVVQMGTEQCQLQIKKTHMYFEKQNGDLAEL